MTTAEVFSNYLGLTPENAPWAFGVRKRCSKCNKSDDPAWRVRCLWCGYEGEKGMPWYTPLEHYVTATSPLAPEPTPGWLEALVMSDCFSGLGKGGKGGFTCIGSPIRKYINMRTNTHPTHAVARALLAADNTLLATCMQCKDWSSYESQGS